jgi:pimeloyl-ACP methyl ester carboxylesterase
VTQRKQVIRRRNSVPSRLATGAGVLAGTMLSVAGGWVLYSNLAINHNVPLPDAIPAERVIFLSKTAGELSYYIDHQASGRPLVLIHSVNAAASAYEMRPLFEYFRSQRPVFALDLPGYGFSERLPRVYTPQIFESAILDLLATQVGEPADVIALSLGCEFIAWAALAQPERFHSLALISPSGFNPPDAGRASQQAGVIGASDVLYSLFSFPLWGRAFFDLIATRRSIEFFLGQSFVGPVAPGLVDYAYATSHQPGAERVPLYFQRVRKCAYPHAGDLRPGRFRPL